MRKIFLLAATAVVLAGSVAMAGGRQKSSAPVKKEQCAEKSCCHGCADGQCGKDGQCTNK